MVCEERCRVRYARTPKLCFAGWHSTASIDSHERTHDMSKNDYFGLGKQFVLGMVHCLPLPGTPKFAGDMAGIIEQAVGEGQTLERGSVYAVIVENMGDDHFGIELDDHRIDTPP